MTPADRSRHDNPTPPKTRAPRTLKGFIRWLAETDAPPNSRNPYRHNRTRGNDIRRHNLLTYLEAMWAHEARLMLVGEAPGYRGLRSTGVPFTSTKLMVTHPFYKGLDFRPIPDAPLQAEATATIMQNKLDDLGLRPVLWNAYPFHPHRAGHVDTNRKPSRKELELGAPFLHWLLNFYQIEQVVAVGNSAETALDLLGISNVKVRHPAQSGATQFREQMVALFG